MFMYCKRCGLIKNEKNMESKCPACEIPLECVPSKYLTSSGLMFGSQALRNEFEELVKKSPEYVESANLEKDKIIAEKEEIREIDLQKKVEDYKNTRVEKHCPVCNSTKLSKISNIKKGAKVVAFGVFGIGDLGKTWKCGTCGHKF